MWFSFVFYVNYMIVSTIIRQAETTKHDFNRVFYSIPRNITSNSWSNDQYSNGIDSYEQPTAIKFSYSADFKTAGDYCHAKGLTGICKLTSKCPEIIRDIQYGKNPIVCSYQISEAVVCCPKRSNHQALNNGQHYPLAASTNSNRIYSTLHPNQANHPTLAPQNIRKVLRPHSSVRRSEKKCEEYSKLSIRSSSFISLSITASTQKVNVPTCTHVTGLIVGGEITKVDEFPHMAAVGWTNDREKEWKCGGSLISEYFVLTAAHCSSLYGISPDVVRLGDQNLESDKNNAQRQEYHIANVIAHPDYRHSSNYDDIALLRLNRNVIFSRFIRPACLWQNSYLNFTKAVATGWGQVGFNGNRSNDLRKVALNIIDNDHCQQLYETSKKLRHGIVRSQLCAGQLKGGKDTCHGDSGGPISVITPKNQCTFHIIGITSFGKACAAVNTAGVYTRVSSYLDWIESIVWP